MNNNTGNVEVKNSMLFFAFLKIGLLTVGGGLVMLPIITDTVVKKKNWLSYEDMSQCIAIGQSVPGVIAINVASAVGYKISGKKGAIFSSLGIILPPFIIITLLYGILDNIVENPFLIGAMKGIKIGLIGVLLATVYRLTKMTFSKTLHYFIFLITAIMVGFMKFSALATLFLCGFLSLIFYSFKDRSSKR